MTGVKPSYAVRVSGLRSRKRTIYVNDIERGEAEGTSEIGGPALLSVRRAFALSSTTPTGRRRRSKPVGTEIVCAIVCPAVFEGDRVVRRFSSTTACNRYVDRASSERIPRSRHSGRPGTREEIFVSTVSTQPASVLLSQNKQRRHESKKKKKKDVLRNVES